MTTINTAIDPYKNITIFGKDLGIKNTEFYLLVYLTVNTFSCYMYYSLLSPFYPGIATEKGMSTIEIGIIFSVYSFMNLILSPFFGKHIESFGIKFLFLAGIFLVFVSQFLFGLMYFIPAGNVYFVMSFTCRAVTGIGSSMASSYAVVGYYYPHNIAKIIALQETFAGAGSMIGPLIGGALFNIGGFPLPFFVTGILSLLMFVFGFFVFPHAPYNQNINKSSLPLLPLLKKPRFITTILVLFCGAVLTDFLEPSMELHLEPFNLSSTIVGLILITSSVSYVIAAPIYGYISDKYPKRLALIMITSLFMIVVPFSFIGPIPMYNLPTEILVIIIALLFFGFFLSGLVVPVYSDMVEIANNAGYPAKDLRTQGVIAGIFNSVWSLGAVVSPIVAGTGIHLIGFPMATFYIITFVIGVGCIFIVIEALQLKVKPVQEVMDQLLEEISHIEK